METVNIIKSKYFFFNIPEYIEEDIDTYLVARKNYHISPTFENRIAMKFAYDEAYMSIKHGVVNGFIPDEEMQRVISDLKRY